MSKSYAQMADEILNGALTDSTKNPYDPTQGHQASLPAMDPNDTLVEMNDQQRNALLGHVGVETKAEPIVEEVKPSPVVTAEEVDTLNEALRIIQKIQEATTVGSIGVNMAGPSGDAKAVKLPGDTNTKPKKRVKAKPKKKMYASNFLDKLKA